jgi:tRNA U34 5-methylaminomethyl-2-thiouridine-forming methyltransferase MnmC
MFTDFFLTARFSGFITFVRHNNYDIGEVSMKVRIIVTADGSHSLLNEDLQEVYHSVNGAIAESDHVFIRAGYNHIAGICESIRLLEIGFGTGLNALLTGLRCQAGNNRVNYLAFEPFPVDPGLIRQLNYVDLLPPGATDIWQKIQDAPWGAWYMIHDHFKLRKIKGKIESYPLPDNHFNLVYFDAFAPEIQWELWERAIFEKLFESLEEGGTLVTYSAKGAVRRELIRAGFRVERLPGPKGKREMLRATKPISG